MTRLNIAEALTEDDIAWFDDSPAPGDPGCICSYCGFLIKKGSLGFKLHRRKEGTEARFCDDCLGELDRLCDGFRDKLER